MNVTIIMKRFVCISVIEALFILTYVLLMLQVAYGQAFMTSRYPKPGSILVFNQTKDQLGSFTLGKRTPICGFPGFTTEFDSYTLHFPTAYVDKLPIGRATSISIALADSLGTGFNYLQVHFNQKLNEFVRSLKLTQCQQNKKDLEVRKLAFSKLSQFDPTYFVAAWLRIVERT